MVITYSLPEESVLETEGEEEEGGAECREEKQTGGEGRQTSKLSAQLFFSREAV